MSETTGALRRQLDSASDLQSVVRTMKALAAANIGQYERAVAALGEYHRAVAQGLGVCFRELRSTPPPKPPARPAVGAIIFGSDQGLVGQFNDAVVEHALDSLAKRPGRSRHLWAVGERVQLRLQDAGLRVERLFTVPNSVDAIAGLIDEIQIEGEAQADRIEAMELFVFHNAPRSAAGYAPSGQRLLPLDARWQKNLAATPWPTPLPPELRGGVGTMRELLHEYLFISLFRACAESLASENASRLAAMQRAEKNIDELRTELTRAFQNLRQNAIDNELFDVLAGYELLTQKNG